MPEPLPQLPLRPTTSHEHYEKYRAGLITRHICLNGRLDEIAWLRGGFDSKTDPAVAKNQRISVETFKRAVTGSNDGSGTMYWQPLALPDYSDEQHLDLPTSAGEGDNPLLTGGLALAAFSLEDLHGVSQHSLEYAKLLFNYFKQCELPGKGGFFLRIPNSTASTPKFASLDEIIGLCVGVYYYYLALEKRNAAQDLEEVRFFVDKLARNLDNHGFWIVPYADEIRADPWLHERYNAMNWGNQCGWIFAYPLTCFLRRILGQDRPLSTMWNGGEFEKFFPTTIINCGDDILSSEKMMWTANLIQRFPWSVDQQDFWLLICGLAGSYFQVDIDWIETAGLAAICPATAVKTLAEAGLDTLLSYLRSEIEGKNYFNIHLLGLAALLVMECSNSGEAKRGTAQAFQALVKQDHGRKNAFFALLAMRGGYGDADMEEAARVMTTLPGAGNPECFQPDLPLGSLYALRYMNCREDEIAEDAPPGGPAAVSGAAAGVRNEFRNADLAKELGVSDLLAEFNAMNLPVIFNLAGLWGEERTWEHICGRHHFTRFWDTGRTMHGYWARYIRFVFWNRQTVMPEADGVDLLFPRMLAAHWGLLLAPEIPPERDVRWPTLPYVAKTPANPANNPTLRLGLDFNPMPAYPQKKLVQLGKHGKTIADFGIHSLSGLHSGNFTGNASDPVYLWGRESIIWGGLFRGQRFHAYTPYDYPIALEVWGSSCCCQYYMEIAETPEALGQAGSWSPVDEETFDGRTLRMPLNTTENMRGPFTHAGKQALCLGVPHRVSQILPSSFVHWRLRARVVLNSVADEDYPVWSSGIFPVTLRKNAVPGPESPYRYFLNPHQGTIHDARCASTRHFREMAATFNILVLPVTQTIDRGWSTERLERAVNSCCATGKPDAAGDFPAIGFRRRDAYAVKAWLNAGTQAFPPQRLAQYLGSHPEAKRRFDSRANRGLRLCSYCFK